MNEFTCVICPWGCLLTAEGDSIGGYSCLRGLNYAKEEITDPKRSISGTVRIYGATQKVLPVKTSAPIPKDLLLQAAVLLRNTSVTAPIKTGEVIIPGILGTDIDFVATHSA